MRSQQRARKWGGAPTSPPHRRAGIRGESRDRRAGLRRGGRAGKAECFRARPGRSPVRDSLPAVHRPAQGPWVRAEAGLAWRRSCWRRHRRPPGRPPPAVSGMSAFAAWRHVLWTGALPRKRRGTRYAGKRRGSEGARRGRCLCGERLASTGLQIGRFEF